MLMIDDNMYRLARMQESLLKVAKADRQKHLDDYVKNVTEIDKKAYDDLINIMKEVNKYNQTLEIELSYLDKIKKAYDQLLELQMRFKFVCEQYGNNDLKLSDMSQLNIEYVENRISAINGYLLNVENINKNKKRLESLNEELVDEEKKRDFLNKKILLFEKKLKDDYVRAYVKQIVFGKLESFNIISEYEKLGYDVRLLVDDSEKLNKEFKNADNQLNEITEKYETAKVCYQSLYNNDNKKIMEDIEKEFYILKYKYTMLKILKLLIQEVENYELAKSKRQEFIKLIKDRSECLNKLGINNTLNILSFVDMDGQLNEIENLSTCVNDIYRIRKEIGELTNRTEEMINQNNDYLISLSETKELIESRVSFKDFDITTFDDIVLDEVKSEPLNNQVVKVKNISSNFKLNIAKQKANGVIERVCKISIKDVKKENVKEEYTPELIIESKKTVQEKVIEEEPTLVVEKELALDNEEIKGLVDDKKLELDTEDEISDNDIHMIEPVDVSLFINDEENVDVFSENVVEESDKKIVVEDNLNLDIFETIKPFEEPVLFTDRTDNVSLVSGDVSFVSEPIVDTNINEEVEMPSIEKESIIMNENKSETISDEVIMPDAFWVTEENPMVEEDSDIAKLSFEEQINALLAENNNEPAVKRR